jgi:ATP-dependent helicase HrpB
MHPAAAKHVLRTRDQLLRLTMQHYPLCATAGSSSTAAESDEPCLRSIFAAYPDRLARCREQGSRRAVMVGGRGVRLAEESALADEELLVCVDVNAAGAEALVRQASAVERSWLPAETLTTHVDVSFDDETGKVTARRRTAYYDLVLEESSAALPDGESISTALVAAAEKSLARVFPADDAAVAGFRARVQCLAQWLPELNLAPLDDEAVRQLLPQLAAGRRSLAELKNAPWLDAMKGLFTWQQLQAIDREAPERLEVPSGSRIAVQYEPGRPPVMAVRIQEVFGLLETPRIARGRVKVLMHLLAPNMRVAQVTDDLANFWASTYTLVRKDLRARYPKHAWPEDPYTAKAERLPTRKK